MTSPDLSAGDRWLQGISAKARKRRGQWPTPWWVVAAVSERACRGLGPGATIVDPACGDGRWLVAAARHVPGARLVGYDTDPTAIEAAGLTCATAGVDATLHCADGLGPLPHADLILGNPPYVRPQHLAPEVRKELWERFDTATDKSDLYCCFVEHALDNADRVALVLPEHWLHLTSFAALRLRVLRAGVEGLFTLPRRTFAAMPTPTLVLHTGAGDQRQAGQLDRQGYNTDSSVHIGPITWSLTGPPPLLPGVPLGQLASVHMGVVCGDYRRYLHPEHSHPADQPTCRGKDVQRWQIAPTHEYLRYLPRDMLARKPYVAPKNASLFDRPQKIVIAGASGRQLRAAMDLERRFPLDSCYIIHATGGTDPWGLLGLLNAPQLSDWYGARFRAPRVKGVELKQLPLPTGSWSAIAEAARARDEAGLTRAVADAYACSGPA